MAGKRKQQRRLLLLLFLPPAKHMAFLYVGEEDRVIVSFHARLDSEKGLRFSSGYTMN